MPKLCFTYDTDNGAVEIGYDIKKKHNDGQEYKEWVLRLGTFDKEHALRKLDQELKECGF